MFIAEDFKNIIKGPMALVMTTVDGNDILVLSNPEIRNSLIGYHHNRSKGWVMQTVSGLNSSPYLVDITDNFKNFSFVQKGVAPAQTTRILENSRLQILHSLR